MPRPIGEWLDDFEAALAAPVPDDDILIAAFRDLVVPSDVTAPDLTRLYAICYRLLGIAEGGQPVALAARPADGQAGHLAAVAGSVVRRTIVDRDARTRAWVAESIERFRARGEAVPEGLDDSQLPPRLDIPFDAVTAAERIRPYLDRLESDMKACPSGHFKFCWDVSRDGYPVFQPIVARWAKDIEGRGIGVPGTVAAIATARVLLDRADKAEPLSWPECERTLLPLLGNPHPMVAAGAARWLGSLCDDRLLDSPGAPDLATVLDRIAGQSRNRAEAAGGFVNGFDSMGEGLAALAGDPSLASVGFDLDGWVLECLAAGKDTAYLPNAQALWFYVHEHYAANPAFVARLIDADRAWIAMMCATEIDRAIVGMRPVLERLAGDPDPAVAEPARKHLARVY